MPVEVDRGVHDPGSQSIDPGNAEAAVVVQSSQVFDDPVGWVVEDVVTDGETASLASVVVGTDAVLGEDVVDLLLPASLSKLESSRSERLVGRDPFGLRR